MTYPKQARRHASLKAIELRDNPPPAGSALRARARVRVSVRVRA